MGSKKAEAESGTALETTKKQGQRPDEDFGPTAAQILFNYRWQYTGHICPNMTECQSEFSGDGSDDNMCD